MFLLIGLIPLLGWINWFTTLPASVLGIIISVIAIIRSPRGTAVVGLVISVTVFVVAVVRLVIGGGII